MSSEMVARVAHAICGCGRIDAEECCDVMWDKARRAIEAMREPAEKMVRGGYMAYGAADLVASDDWLKSLYGAMIDAALADDITANPVRTTERQTAGNIPFPVGSFRAEG